MQYSDESSDSNLSLDHSDSETEGNNNSRRIILRNSSLDNLVHKLNTSLILNSEDANTNNMSFSVKDITQNHVAVIPVYEGDPNTLSMYISACEYLIGTFFSSNTLDPINAFLLRLFQSKLAGRALQLVGSREVISSWGELKQLLQLNFCDQRSERCLVQDLMQLKPERGETAYNFGLRCKNMLNLLLTKVKMSEPDVARRTVKSELHNDTILQTYLRGIVQFGDIGHRVRFRNPTNIETAMSYVLEEENFNYFTKQPNNVNKSEFKPMKQQTPLGYVPAYNSKPMVSQLNQVPNFVRQTTNTPSWGQTTHRPQFQNQSQQQRQFKPMYQQQMKPFQMNKPASFKFARSPGQLEQKRQPRQTPMEMGSARTIKPGPSGIQPFTSKPNWVAEELYYQEDDERYQDEQYETTDHCEQQVDEDDQEVYVEEDEDVNFHITASGNNNR